MEYKLNLRRPLAFIDLETTGTNIVTDRIIEISILKIFPDSRQEINTKRVNPTIPIPLEVTKLIGISDDDVKDHPPFSSIAKNLMQFLDNCDLAGYNSNRFDVPLIVEEFLRADVDFDIKNRKLIDVQNIFHKMEQRTLSAAYKFYCNKDLLNAHRAEADIVATFEVFQAQLTKYQELQNDITYLHDFCSHNNNVDLAGRIIMNDKNEEVFNFGKHKGKTVEEVFRIEPSYYDWMMKGEFPLHTKKVITAIRLRGFNKQ